MVYLWNVCNVCIIYVWGMGAYVFCVRNMACCMFWYMCAVCVLHMWSFACGICAVHTGYVCAVGMAYSWLVCVSYAWCVHGVYVPWVFWVWCVHKIYVCFWGMQSV